LGEKDNYSYHSKTEAFSFYYKAITKRSLEAQVLKLRRANTRIKGIAACHIRSMFSLALGATQHSGT